MFHTLFDRIFGKSGQRQIIAGAAAQGALLVDVRTPAEFQQGSVRGAVNYPVQQIDALVEYVEHIQKPVIVFCASGIRSAAARSKLRRRGIEVFNARTVQNMNSILSEAHYRTRRKS